MIVASIRIAQRMAGMTVAELVARRRDELGISQATLAKRIDRHPSFISQIEQRANPRYLPDPELALALAKALEMRVDELTAAAGYVDEDQPAKTEPDPLADPDVRFYASQYSRMTEEKRAAVRAVIRAFAADQK